MVYREGAIDVRARARARENLIRRRRSRETGGSVAISVARAVVRGEIDRERVTGRFDARIHRLFSRRNARYPGSPVSPR